MNYKVSTSILEQMRILLQQGQTATQVAKKLNLYPGTVLKYKRKYQLIPNRAPITKNENYFENLDTAEKVYWLGFIWADGCIMTFVRSKALVICLSSADRDHLEKFSKAIEYGGEIREYTNTMTLLANPNAVTKDYTQIRLPIYSKKLYDDLINLGLTPRKTYGVPDFSKIPKEFISHFIRGYFDGDGTAAFYKRTDSTDAMRIKVSITGQKESMVELKKLIEDDSGIHLNIYPHKDNNRTIELPGFSSMLKFKDYLYKDATKLTYLERKHNKFLEAEKYFLGGTYGQKHFGDREPGS